MAKMVVRTCTLRTSLIFLRCALATKPAEVSVVRQKYGTAVATLYHTAFLARNGNAMCNDANYNWARCYFNRVANDIFKLQLNDLRHVWVAVSQAIASSVADRVQCAKTKQLLAKAAARMSNHSLETEVGEYAGQADISGVEEQDRKVFKALSMEFNCRVFGDKVGHFRYVSSIYLICSLCPMCSISCSLSVTFYCHPRHGMFTHYVHRLSNN